MFFYLYKKTIAQLRLVNGVKKEYFKVDKYLLGHTYKIMYIMAILTNPILSLIVEMLTAVTGIIFCIMAYKLRYWLFYILTILSIFIMFFIGLILRRINKMCDKGKDLEEAEKEIISRMLDIYSINPLVISYADWRKMKQISKINYEAIRSVKSIAECYETTFYIANILRKKQIKIMWILNNTFGEKYGHAILIKGNYVYDSNRRRTYSKSKYFKIN